MRTIQRHELAACNGQDGALAWVAYRGRVHEVTSSSLWQRGRHAVRHVAGVD